MMEEKKKKNKYERAEKIGNGIKKYGGWLLSAAILVVTTAPKITKNFKK